MYEYALPRYLLTKKFPARINGPNFGGSFAPGRIHFRRVDGLDGGESGDIGGIGGTLGTRGRQGDEVVDGC